MCLCLNMMQVTFSFLIQHFIIYDHTRGQVENRLYGWGGKIKIKVILRNKTKLAPVKHCGQRVRTTKGRYLTKFLTFGVPIIDK